MLAFAMPASTDSDDATIVDRDLPFSRWETMSRALDLGKQFPLVVIYGKDGRCIGKLTPETGWKAESLDDPAADKGASCAMFLSDGPGSAMPNTTTQRTAHLYVLDLPFCTGCIAVEDALRAFVQAHPETWRLEITRVQEPTERVGS